MHYAKLMATKSDSACMHGDQTGMHSPPLTLWETADVLVFPKDGMSLLKKKKIKYKINQPL